MQNVESRECSQLGTKPDFQLVDQQCPIFLFPEKLFSTMVAYRYLFQFLAHLQSL